eukprot:UN2633
MPQHFRQHWIVPCSNCQRTAHRACLEKRLLTARSLKGDGSSTPKLRCSACSREYRASKRFPESLPELLRATRQEWRWVLRRVFVTMCFFSWIYTLAGHYMSKAGVSIEVSVLLLFTATIMSISAEAGSMGERGAPLTREATCACMSEFGLCMGMAADRRCRLALMFVYGLPIELLAGVRASADALEVPGCKVRCGAHAALPLSLAGSVI